MIYIDLCNVMWKISLGYVDGFDRVGCILGVEVHKSSPYKYGISHRVM